MKRKFLFFIIFFILIINSCTGILIKAAYNNADWFIKNEVDKLFNITWNQDSILSDGLLIFLDEHREKELPLLYVFMENLKMNTVKDHITLKEIYQTTNDFIVLRNRFFDTFFNDDFTEFITTINRDQVVYFEEKINRFIEPHIGKDGKTFQDRSDQENHDRILQRRKKNMITWFGSITPHQEKAINDFPLFSKKYSDLFYQERKRIGTLIVDQLYRQSLEQVTSEDSVDLIKKLLSKSRENVDPHYLQAFDERNLRIYNFLLTLHQTLTPEQKKFFYQQVEYYQNIVSDLMEST